MSPAGGGSPRRDRPPRPAPRRSFVVPQPEVLELPGGLRLLVMVDRRLPLLCLDWVMPAGARLDPPSHAGRAALTAFLLDEGTRRFSGPQIADRIEGLGGALGCSADWDATYAGCSVRSEHLEAALELLQEVVLHPTFPEAEVSRCRDLQIGHLRQRRDRPSRLAGDQVAAALYAGTPYAVPASGLVETVAALSRSDLESFWSDHLLTSGTALVVVGDVDPQRLAALLAAEAPAAASSSPGPAPPLDAPPLDSTRVWIVDRPQAPQTELRVAHAGPPRQHPDWPALKLLSLLLGGTFTSRLMRTLREERGLTYGVSAGFTARNGPGPFSVATALSTEAAGEAVALILREMDELRQHAPGEEELRTTCDYLVGVVPQRFETIEDTGSQLAALLVFDLGLDYFERFEAVHRAVTPDDVAAAARRHLHPDRCAVVAVGPAEELRPQLEELGPVEIV